MSAHRLVSILLCTHGERDLLPIALSSYLSQTWEPKELVVVSDGPEVFDLMQGIPELLYVRLPEDATSLSAKRNIGCRAARGEFIVHFDSDDWSGPDRITDQVEMMLANPFAQLGGYAQAFWWDAVDQRASRYNGSIWGATMIYRREYSLSHPWDEKITNAEDGPFQEAARLSNAIVNRDGAENFVATLHRRNARRAAAGNCAQWPFVDVAALPVGFQPWRERLA